MRLIDADYVLHKMDTTDLQPRTETEHYAFGFAKEILRNAPTIEAEPVKHGRWIIHREEIFEPNRSECYMSRPLPTECSVCGFAEM